MTERHDRWIAKYLAGEALQDIADADGVTKNAVRNMLRARGLIQLKPRPAMRTHYADARAERKVRWMEMLRRGASTADIAAHEGLSKHHVEKVMLEVGLAERTVERMLKRDVAALAPSIRDAWRSGKPVDEIVEATGASRSVVYRALHGLTSVVGKRVRPPGRPKEQAGAFSERHQRWIDRNFAGEHIARIAADEGVSRQAVHAAIRRYREISGRCPIVEQQP